MKKLFIVLALLTVTTFAFSQDKVNVLVQERINFLTNEIEHNNGQIARLINLNAKNQTEINELSNLVVTVIIKPK